jgi:hypothetical protein
MTRGLKYTSLTKTIKMDKTKTTSPGSDFLKETTKQASASALVSIPTFGYAPFVLVKPHSSENKGALYRKFESFQSTAILDTLYDFVRVYYRNPIESTAYTEKTLPPLCSLYFGDRISRGPHGRRCHNTGDVPENAPIIYIYSSGVLTIYDTSPVIVPMNPTLPDHSVYVLVKTFDLEDTPDHSGSIYVSLLQLQRNYPSMTYNMLKNV